MFGLEEAERDERGEGGGPEGGVLYLRLCSLILLEKNRTRSIEERCDVWASVLSIFCKLASSISTSNNKLKSARELSIQKNNMETFLKK